MAQAPAGEDADTTEPERENPGQQQLRTKYCCLVACMNAEWLAEHFILDNRVPGNVYEGMKDWRQRRIQQELTERKSFGGPSTCDDDWERYYGRVADASD
ncbi:hypothetical protein Mkiyose1665_11380 [Mycobacterium kiyosense]|uniref:Uncharacterized protein n=1 Tax=Mycobacterium kiyosense TaxID=2871094 RepID=A0A9P3QBG2_9MYCO|nr:hypothetical protein IWGMT90018_17150 [Mycobacterium kiyosense]BDE13025.1 hypothetical protein MKCMC460_18850 [Mycobacterium sp. 20KCMC460]GLB85081.1 hypothetical protein SRL2020028_43370 [Mycobacterium kiyosense]GLB92114.1 hypothetical protein SRL2020130_49310 [Mycobacterium kiyosense]GLB97614.1 hypothetical protein SRL2020226_43900 [Mycobacterium kiyosense]